MSRFFLDDKGYFHPVFRNHPYFWVFVLMVLGIVYVDRVLAAVVWLLDPETGRDPGQATMWDSY